MGDLYTLPSNYTIGAYIEPMEIDMGLYSQIIAIEFVYVSMKTKELQDFEYDFFLRCAYCFFSRLPTPSPTPFMKRLCEIVRDEALEIYDGLKAPQIQINTRYRHEIENGVPILILLLDYRVLSEKLDRYKDSLRDDFLFKKFDRISIPRSGDKILILPPNRDNRHEILGEMRDHDLKRIEDIVIKFVRAFPGAEERYDMQYIHDSLFNPGLNLMKIMNSFKKEKKLFEFEINQLSMRWKEKNKEKDALIEFIDAHYYDFIESLLKIGDFKICKNYQDSLREGKRLYKGCKIIIQRPKKTKHGNKYPNYHWDKKKFCTKQCKKQYSKSRKPKI